MGHTTILLPEMEAQVESQCCPCGICCEVALSNCFPLPIIAPPMLHNHLAATGKLGFSTTRLSLHSHYQPTNQCIGQVFMRTPIFLLLIIIPYSPINCQYIRPKIALLTIQSHSTPIANQRVIGFFQTPNIYLSSTATVHVFTL